MVLFQRSYRSRRRASASRVALAARPRMRARTCTRTVGEATYFACNIEHNCLSFSMCVRNPCAGAMLISSASFQC